MTSRIFPGFAAVGTAFLVSCYPYPEARPTQPSASSASITSAEQQSIQEQRARMKERAEQLKKEEEQKVAATQNQIPTTPPNLTENTQPKPAETKRTDYPFANPVPGKEGLVFSPYNQKVVDVREIPSGTLVQDPTYPAAEKKYFRVP